MLQTTKGIVLRSVKYGETSLITTIFTATTGVQSYMVQGVRSSKSKQARGGLLQPSTLLDLVVYHKPQTSLHRLREFQPAYIYTTLHEEVVKNSIALFSAEVLLRLLPEHAPMPELFDMAFDYYCQLDKRPLDAIANFPIYFVMTCSQVLGYEIHGTYGVQTPYLNLHDGAFASTPGLENYLHDEDARMLARLMDVKNIDELSVIEMNASMRNRLLDWYIEFLQRHTQHMGNIKSLVVLRAILH